MRENPLYDLLALTLILATVTVLLLKGVGPEAIAAIGATLTGLFATWRQRHDRGRQSEEDAAERR
jgi:hypothetical protein